MLAVSQRLFTVDEYHAMGRAGIFGEDDRVELIEGQILAMAPIGDAHVRCVNQLLDAVGEGLFSGPAARKARISVQNPVKLGTRSEPQPDLALVSRAGTAGTPSPGDILLLVEVADTSLDFDLEGKVPRYAAAGIPEVWVVDLREREVHVFRNPSHGAYAEHTVKSAGEELDVQYLPELPLVPVSELFG